MNFGIVILSRASSARIPNKVFRQINDSTVLNHLIDRCRDVTRELLIQNRAQMPVILAVPPNDAKTYQQFESRVTQIYYGHGDDPLARMSAVAESYEFDAVVRICHDKILIAPELIAHACKIFELKNLDYLYSSQFTDGSGFEVISRQALKLAAAKYKNVEHISYAIKNVTSNTLDLEVPREYRSSYRFLIDYPDDLTALEVILAANGDDCTLQKAIAYVEENPWISRLNQLPTLTVYTCAYNAEKWIEKAMGSVFEQFGFRGMEYLLIDDHSTDRTPALMAKAASRHKNVRFIRNPKNIGLAASSNVALHESRGKFILRLDADDYLATNGVLNELLNEIVTSKKDAIYPNNYFGSLKKIQNGKEQHHVGGSIFRRNAVNHVKFTELLRGYEGLDFFLRARGQLNIGYYGKPTFFYRQRKDSMSKTNLAERAKLKAKIESEHATPA